MSRALCSLVFLAMAASSLAAQQCNDLVLRLWQPTQERYYQAGEPLVLNPGEKADLYVHYRSQSKSPYTTSAEVGYSQPLGLGGPKPEQTVRIVRMEQQKEEDIRVGRITLQAADSGRTQLGFRMRGIHKSGLFERIPGNCKQGLIDVEVQRRQSQKPDSVPAAVAAERVRAAHALLGDLHQALLRRPAPAQLPSEQLELVVRQGHRGAVLSAMEITSSPSFQRLAPANRQDLRRYIEARSATQAGTAPRGERFDLSGPLKLLSEIYQDLYGTPYLAGKEHEAYLLEMATCFSDLPQQDGACKRLGRDLVKTQRYADHHKTQLKDLPESYSAEQLVKD